MSAVERLPALYNSVDFIFVSSGNIWIPLWNFETIRRSLVRPKCLKLASLAQKICTLYTFSSLVYSLLPLPKDNLFKSILK